MSPFTYSLMIGHPSTEQAAMEPKAFSTFSKPFFFKIVAAIMARIPLPQKVTTGRSLET
jgi:hypothetical protein